MRVVEDAGKSDGATQQVAIAKVTKWAMASTGTETAELYSTGIFGSSAGQFALLFFFSATIAAKSTKGIGESGGAWSGCSAVRTDYFFCCPDNDTTLFDSESEET